jgi:hypothetical protein
MLIVQGTPFYGYHPKPKLFVQIFLYNPRVVSAVVQLLESGCVGERRFQPYEAHVPFLLQVRRRKGGTSFVRLFKTKGRPLAWYDDVQVFADYNIEGMNSVAFSDVKVSLICGVLLGVRGGDADFVYNLSSGFLFQ